MDMRLKMLLLYTVKQLLREMEEKFIVVEFLWVPSQIGIEGNERVDELAKEALEESTEDEVLYQCSELNEKF